MENNNGNNGFQYTYSAREQAELKRIRDKYTSPTEEEDKMERLRRLDASVAGKALTISLIFGIVGALLLGTGMSLCMTDFAKILGSYQNMAMVIGVIIGVLGCALVALAYPIYNLTLKRERRKIAPEIIRLTDELMK